MTSDAAAAEQAAFYAGAHEQDPAREEPEIVREPVKPTSSNVASVGWAGANPDDGTLEVEFVGGAVYRYDHVPGAVRDNMVGTGPQAPLSSVGKYFTAVVKRWPDKYPHRRMRRPGVDA